MTSIRRKESFREDIFFNRQDVINLSGARDSSQLDLQIDADMKTKLLPKKKQETCQRLVARISLDEPQVMGSPSSGWRGRLLGLVQPKVGPIQKEAHPTPIGSGMLCMTQHRDVSPVRLQLKERNQKVMD